jgi:hypothetical protein
LGVDLQYNQLKDRQERGDQDMNEVKTLFLNENDGENLLHCPYCGDEYVHLCKPLTFSGGEGYDARHLAV